MRADLAHEETDRLLMRLEKRLNEEYSKAAKEVAAKLKDYQRRFATKNRIRLDALARIKDPDKYLEELDKYKKWYAQQVLVEQNWQKLSDEIAHDMHDTNLKAKAIIREYQIPTYLENNQYQTYLIEHAAGIDTSYTLINESALSRIVMDDPKLLPDPGRRLKSKIAAGKDILWNRQELSSIAMQSIMQGESIPKIASRIMRLGPSYTEEDIKNAANKTADDIAKELAKKNRNAAIRNARTMMTGAENAGREDAAIRAKARGVDIVQIWLATLDMRTRHEHRLLDGQQREIGEPFEVDGETIMFPGDPEAPGHLVYNCRCRVVMPVRGFEPNVASFEVRSDPNVLGMTYEEWKSDRREKTKPLTLPEEKGEAIKWSYIGAYRKLAEDNNE